MLIETKKSDLSATELNLVVGYADVSAETPTAATAADPVGKNPYESAAGASDAGSGMNDRTDASADSPASPTGAEPTATGDDAGTFDPTLPPTGSATVDSTGTRLNIVTDNVPSTTINAAASASNAPDLAGAEAATNVSALASGGQNVANATNSSGAAATAGGPSGSGFNDDAASASDSAGFAAASIPAPPPNSPDPTEQARWASNVITWSFAASNLADQPIDTSDLPGTSQIVFSDFVVSGSEEALLYEKAAELWQSVSGITLRLVPDSTISDIRVGYEALTAPRIGFTWIRWDGLNHLLPDNVSATEDPNLDPLVASPDGDLTYSGAPLTNFFQVAVHELGHALGLDHNLVDTQQAVMAAVAGPTNRSVDSNDVATIDALYGVNPAGNPTVAMTDNGPDNYTVASGGTVNPFAGLTVTDGVGLHEVVSVTVTGGGTLSDPTAATDASFTNGVFFESGTNLQSLDYAQEILNRLVYTEPDPAVQASFSVTVENSLVSEATNTSITVSPAAAAPSASAPPAAAPTPTAPSATAAPTAAASAAQAAPSAGSGADTVHGSHDQYIIANNNGALYVQDTVASRDGTQTLAADNTVVFTDGTGVFDPTGTAEDVDRLYSAALNRAPDVTGLKYWSNAVDESNVPLATVANDLASSPEFIADYGTLPDAAFVQQLYQNVLNRPGDAAGSQYWQSALAAGTTRGQVVLNFSAGAENLAKTLPTSGDKNTSEAYRVYQAALDRAPDQAGQAYWSSALANGMTSTGLAQGFIASAEFMKKYGTLSTSDFVSQLYQNVLHRAADQGGLQFWTTQLDQGTSQASVLVAFADGIENRVQTAGATHDGWVFIPS